jgi:alkylation response protein AidB-like acyl-CoA dehydrogenase
VPTASHATKTRRRTPKGSRPKAVEKRAATDGREVARRVGEGAKIFATNAAAAGVGMTAAMIAGHALIRSRSRHKRVLGVPMHN